MQDYIKTRLYSIDNTASDTIQYYIEKVEEYLKQDLVYDGTNNGTERHHIVPRSIAPDLIDDSNNIVVLTYQQHIELHRILANINNPSLIFAFWHTTSKRRRKIDEQTWTDLLVECKSKLQKVNGRPVVNLNTQEVFASVAAAARNRGCKVGTIRMAIRTKTRAKNNFWMYVDNVNKPLDELLVDFETDLQQRITNNNQKLSQRSIDNLSKQVINLNTKQIFDNVRAAAEYYGVCTSSIHQAIRTKIKSRECYWAYVENVDDPEDLLKQYQVNSQQIQDEKNAKHSALMTGNGNSNRRPIINLNTGEILLCARLLDDRIGAKPNYTVHAMSRFTKIEGSLWTYYDSTLTLEQHRAKVQKMHDDKLRRQEAKTKWILCVETGKIYKNAVEASKDVGIIPQRIRFAANSGYKANGQTWKYVEKNDATQKTC